MPLYIIPQRFQHRRGTYLELYARNEVLLPGEECFETQDVDGNDLNPWLCKVGDGVTRWNDLEYQSTGGGVSDIAGEIHAATGKTTPVDADELALVDSAASNVLKKLTWANLKATVKAYFDTLYEPLGGGPGGWMTIVKKTADTSRNSTTTPTDDPHLSFACAAGTRYRVAIRVQYSVTDATPDFKFVLAYSGTTTGTETVIRKHMAPQSALGSANLSVFAQSAGINASFAPTGSNTGVGFVEYDITFVTNTSGTFSFQWAQNTSHASNVTVLAGSYLEYATF